jgi:hypothetical protein
MVAEWFKAPVLKFWKRCHALYRRVTFGPKCKGISLCPGCFRPALSYVVPSSWVANG